MVLSDVNTLLEDHNNYLQELFGFGAKPKLDALGRPIKAATKQVVTGTTKYGTPKVDVNTYKPKGQGIGVSGPLMFGAGAAGVAGVAKLMDNQ